MTGFPPLNFRRGAARAGAKTRDPPFWTLGLAAPAGRVGSGAPGVVRAARRGGGDAVVVNSPTPAAGGRSHAVRTETLRAHTAVTARRRETWASPPGTK